jgi:carbonic anhydrase
MRTQSKETLKNLTPEKALRILREGNHRFINNLKANRNLLQQVNDTADGQYPFAAILSCMDSRTSAELIFDQGLGDIFSIRVAGNVLNEDILGSMEFAVEVVGSRIILVLGHSKCGAITGACNNVKLGHLTGLLQKIEPAIQREKKASGNREGANQDFVDRVTRQNVLYTIERIRKESEIISRQEKDGKIKIVGGVYNVETGVVDFFEDDGR